MHDYRDVSDGRRRSARGSTPSMIHTDQTSQDRFSDHQSGTVPGLPAAMAPMAPPTFLSSKRKASNVLRADTRQTKRARVLQSTETASGPQPASNHRLLTRSSSKNQEMLETQPTASGSGLKSPRSTRSAQPSQEASGSRPTRALPKRSNVAPAGTGSRLRKQTQAKSSSQEDPSYGKGQGKKAKR